LKTAVSCILAAVGLAVLSSFPGRAVKITAKEPIMQRILTVALLFLLTLTAMARDLGTFGTVYDIVEKDALKELEEKAKSVNFSKAVDRNALVKKARNFTPEDVKETKMIGPARKDRTFLVDMTYTLERDIKDDKGNIVYPAGYRFNPLSYVAYPRTLVILNGKQPGQMRWFENSPYAKDAQVTLLLTDGSYSELSRSLKRPVFYASMKLIEAFRIRAVPSVVRQSGAYMEVTEVRIPPKHVGQGTIGHRKVIDGRDRGPPGSSRRL
jgi:conjugal transfer pilus assembly protein TraW